jgi:hypothetical protein
MVQSIVNRKITTEAVETTRTTMETGRDNNQSMKNSTTRRRKM